MEDFRNDLLNRREVWMKINLDGNPGFEQALKIVAEKFNAEEENIAIKNVKNSFGSNDFLIKAFIYDSKEHKHRIEPKPKMKKKLEGEKK